MTTIKNPILEGSIFSALTKFSLPILLSLILQALYGAVDLLMVSQFASSADISAVSTGSQTMLIVNGIVTGLSMGITILLGRSVGQQDYHKSANLIGTSIWIFSVMGIFMTVLLLASAAPLASLLHAPPAAYTKPFPIFSFAALAPCLWSVSTCSMVFSADWETPKHRFYLLGWRVSPISLAIISSSTCCTWEALVQRLQPFWHRQSAFFFAF